MNGVSKSVVIVIATVTLVIGGGIGMVLKNKDDNKVRQVTSDTPAADLRTLLNNLETEHVALAAAATRAGFNGDASFQAAAKALDDNSNALADAVGSVYGQDARKKFYDIWNSHIGFFVDYTVAAKKGDKAGMDKAVANLNGYVESISIFLNSANPNLPKEAVAKLVSEHVNLLKAAVDTHGAGNFSQSYMHQHEADTQISQIADTLAGAIVKQKPENFPESN